MNAPMDAVAVAVGPDGHDAALAFAVAEARRTSRPLHLVHVLRLPAGEAYVGIYGGMLDAARSILDEATRAATELADPGTTVTSHLIDQGNVVDRLVEHTRDAAMLVVQHRDLSTVRRVFVGSFSETLAGRAHVPVVSVPQGWQPRVGVDNLVTAATQHPDEAPSLLRVAFEEARSRGARLRVLHAWWLASGYDVVVVDDQFRAEWAARSEDELAPVLAPLRAEFPDVAVTVHVRHAPPVEAVLDAALDSDLLVLGRRHHLLPLGSHLGPVARAALAHAANPVLVTPETPAPATVAVPVEAASVEHLAPAGPM
jgi:nucleotide-binding universal stress UspA family protein